MVRRSRRLVLCYCYYYYYYYYTHFILSSNVNTKQYYATAAERAVTAAATEPPSNKSLLHVTLILTSTSSSRLHADLSLGRRVRGTDHTGHTSVDRPVPGAQRMVMLTVLFVPGSDVATRTTRTLAHPHKQQTTGNRPHNHCILS